MALKINKQIESVGGLIIPTGAIIRFTTSFPESGMTMENQLIVYPNAQAQTDKQNVMPKCLIGKTLMTKKLTQQDYDSLTPLAVHQWLKSELEAIPEIGKNVEIIL